MEDVGCIFWSGFDFVLPLAVLAPILSVIVTVAYNKLVPHAKESNLQKVWEYNDFDSLLAFAASQNLPMAFTLENNKVYVGIISRTSEPHTEHSESAHISILPLYSGYRDKERLDLILTTEYGEVFDWYSNGSVEPDLTNYNVVVPLSRIISANIFHYEIYEAILEYDLPADQDN